MPGREVGQLTAAICAVDNCVKPVKHKSGQYCYAHYMKNWRYGTPTPEHRKFRQDLTGLKIGKITVVAFHSDAKWKCVCDCGKMFSRRTGELNRAKRTGETATCGSGICRRKPDGEYMLAHHRLRRDLGAASNFNCIKCGNQARQWAYDHGDPNEMYSEMAGIEGIAYSLDASHYMPMCVKCHKRFDMDRLGGKIARKSKT